MTRKKKWFPQDFIDEIFIVQIGAPSCFSMKEILSKQDSDPPQKQHSLIYSYNRAAKTYRHNQNNLWILYEARGKVKYIEGDGGGGKVKIKVKLISNFYTSVWDGVQFCQTVVCRLKRSRVTAERNAGMLFWWCRWRATISPRVLENSVSISCMLPLEPWTKTQHTITSNQTHCICFHTKKKNFQSEASSLKSCYSLLGISVCACVCIHSRVKVSKSVWIN